MRWRIPDRRSSSILSFRTVFPLPFYLTTLLLHLQLSSLAAAEDGTTVISATTTMTLINTITKPATPTPTANATTTATASFGGLLPIATGISPASPDYSFVDEVTFAAGILNAVNSLRAKHDAQPLVWDVTLAKYAGWWANGCNFTKSFSPYTELLLQNASSPTSSVVDTWADTSYTPASAQRADNYTGLIWKASSSIGCGRQQCSGKPTGSPFFSPEDLAKAHASDHGWGAKEKDESHVEGELGVFHGSAPPPQNTGADAVRAAGWYIVCEVAPQGNVESQYEANVDGWGDGSGSGEGWRREGVLGKARKDSGAGMAAGAGKEKIAVWAGWVFTGLAVGMGLWA